MDTIKGKMCTVCFTSRPRPDTTCEMCQQIFSLKGERKCRICGNEENVEQGRNGVMACKRCKSFYASAVRKPRERELACRGSGNCEIPPGKKNVCYKCKFEKCQRLLKKPDEVALVVPADTRNVPSTSTAAASNSEAPEEIVDRAPTRIIYKRFIMRERSKSAEPLKGRPKDKEPPKKGEVVVTPKQSSEPDSSMKKYLSELSLEEIEKHAKSRIEKVEEQFEVGIQKMDEELREPAMKVFHAIVANNRVFTDIPTDENVWNFDTLASLLTAGEKLSPLEVHDGWFLFQRRLPKYSIHCVEKMEADHRTQITSGIMDKYRGLKIAMSEAMKEASERCAEEMENLKTLFPSAQFSLLFMSYEAIFAFNDYLFQHLCHLLISNIFNQYDVYQTLESNKFWKFGMRCDLVTARLPEIVGAFWNTEPLRRQLEELEAIRPTTPDEKIMCYVATLSRKAMERVRLPSTAIEPNTEYHWISRHSTYGDTVDVLHFQNANHVLNPNFKKFLFMLEKLNYNPHEVKAHCSQFVHDKCSPIGTLFKGFVDQSEKFYKGLLPKGKLDRMMKMFFQNQLAEKLWAIVRRETELPDVKRTLDWSMILTATISKPETYLTDWAATTRDNLNSVYIESLRHLYLMLPVSPAHFGMAFVVMEEQLFVSIVKEKSELLEGVKMDQGERERDVKFQAILDKVPHLQPQIFHYPNTSDLEQSAEILCLFDKETLELWISLTYGTEDQKSERALLKILDKEHFEPGKYLSDTDWEKVETEHVKPLRNNLKRALEGRNVRRNVIDWEALEQLGLVAPRSAQTARSSSKVDR